MFFELRQYRTKPGQREKWVKFMEEEIIPFQVSKGMVILGRFVGQEEDDLCPIRRFVKVRQSGNGCIRPSTRVIIGRPTLPPRCLTCSSVNKLK
jgi:hypothetical protein